MKHIWLLVATVMLAACSSSDSMSDKLAEGMNEAQPAAPSTPVAEEEMLLDDEMLNDIISSIPSPIELTALLKSSGAKFTESYLSDADMAENFTSQYDKAINLGVYGADLGYINIYGENHVALSHLSAIKGLADDLSIGEFFDFNTIRRLASNSQDLDSMIYISTTGFERMNKHLQSKNRSNVSVMILFGGWLESLHLAIEVAKDNPENQELRDMVYEEHIVLGDMMLLLENYQNQPGVQVLLPKLEELSDAFSGVTVETTSGGQEVQEINGVMTVVDNSTTEIRMSAAQFDSIASKVGGIRADIIS